MKCTVRQKWTGSVWAMCVPGGPLKGRLTFKLKAEAICLELTCPDCRGGGCVCGGTDTSPASANAFSTGPGR